MLFWTPGSGEAPFTSMGVPCLPGNSRAPGRAWVQALHYQKGGPLTDLGRHEDALQGCPVVAMWRWWGHLGS